MGTYGKTVSEVKNVTKHREIVLTKGALSHEGTSIEANNDLLWMHTHKDWE